MIIRFGNNKEKFGIKYSSFDNAGLKYGISNENLILYLPLDKERNITNTNQNIISYGNVKYLNKNGINCAYFDGNSYLEIINNSSIKESNANSLSIWIGEQVSISNPSFFYTEVKDQAGYAFIVCETTSSSNITFGGRSISSDSLQKNVVGFDNSWNHYCAIFDYINKNIEVYKNGILQSIVNVNFKSNVGIASEIAPICIGSVKNDSSRYCNGYLSSIRLYNRKLTINEINKLSQEFKI